MTEEAMNAITEKIIGCSYAVANGLVTGFMERVYRNALVHELRKAGMKAEPECHVEVIYDGVNVGTFITDILVEETVVVELKAVEHQPLFVAQCLNYLKATGKPICLLINFGKPKVDVKRYRNFAADERR